MKEQQALEEEVRLLFEQCKANSSGSDNRVQQILNKSRYELGLSEGFSLCAKIAWAMIALVAGPSRRLQHKKGENHE